MTRKTKLGILAIAALCLFALAGYALWIEPRQLHVTQVRYEASRWDNTDAKIVFFTDTHVGKNFTIENLETVIEKINQQEPDLVLFGGDLVDSYYRDMPDKNALKETLNKIEAKYGKYAVLGNHDYGGGAQLVYQEIMEDSGFIILKNQSVYIEQLDLLLTGVDDFMLGDPKMPTESEQVSYGYHILLSHAPDWADTVSLTGVDLVLSGHTHGGQVNLPILRDLVLPPGGRHYVKGQYQVTNQENTSIFVSNGIGTTKLPVRFSAPPEIVVLQIENNGRES